MATQRLNDIHNLRAFIIILIVNIHVIDSFFQMGNQAWLMHFLWVLSSNASGVFLFISGFLFQHLIKQYQYSHYLRRKFFNVILPYFIATFPLILKRLHEGDTLFQDYPTYQKIILYYLTGGHAMYLWFIPVVILFFLAAPVLNRLDKKPHFYWIILPILLCLSLTIHRELHQPFVSFVHYGFFYVFGMFASHYRQWLLDISKQWVSILIPCALILIFSQVILRYHFDFISNSFTVPPLLYLDIIPLFFTVNMLKWVFIIPLLLVIFYQLDQFLGKKFAWLANMSFGIYFLHGYAISVLTLVIRKLNGGTQHLADNPVTLLMLLATVILLCVVPLAILKFIFKKHSRMLTGY